MKARTELLTIGIFLPALINALGQPVIITQPQSQAVMLYQPAAFGVIARGTPPLYYQWRKDGVPIAGAAYDQILLPHPQFSDAGSYSVVVSNAERSVPSADARLTVNSPNGGDLDYSFAWGASINGAVRSIAVQPDGRVLIAGEFSAVNGPARSGVARLNVDGTIDYTFMNGLSGVRGTDFASLSSLAVQSDGKVLIGGYFIAANGENRTNVARLNADGTLDGGFQNGLSGADNWVRSVAAQGDDKVLIGGDFINVNGVSQPKIARLNADGTLDSGFQPQIFSDACCARVYSVAVQSDGKVLIGGYFTTVNGVSRTNIAKLNVDGTLDSGFETQISSASGGGYVSSVAVQSDGEMFIGGYFTTVNGVSRTNVFRLNADGSLDSGFQNAVSWGNSSVTSIALQSDGKVLICGGFTTLNGLSRNGIVRLNVDGTLDSSFQNGLSEANGANGDVYSVAVQSNGDVIVGGSMWRDTDNGVKLTYLTRLNVDGTVGSGFDSFLHQASGANRPVTSVAVQSDGRVIIGGRFTTVNGVSRNFTARLNADGTLDTGFQSELSGTGGGVRAVAVLSDGKVLIGGQFFSVNGEVSGGIARLNVNGTFDDSFRFEANDVQSLAVQSDGKVLIGGQLLTTDGSGIARLNANGTLDKGFQTALGPGGETVYAVAVQDNGKVIIAGFFTTVNGVSRNNIARLNSDGTLDSGFQNGLSGIFPQVNSLALQSDGKILIGGGFTTVNDVSRNEIARLNADGTLDSGFQNGLSGANRIRSIALQNDGKVLIGGGFITVNGVSRNYIARLNADGTLDSGFQNALPGLYSPPDGGGDAPLGVSSIALQSGGKIFIAGDFTKVNGIPAARIARLWGDQPAYIESVTRPNSGSITLALRLPPGSTNSVQYKNDLNESAWIDLPGAVVVSGSDSITNKVDATLGTGLRRFYRVRRLP